MRGHYRVLRFYSPAPVCLYYVDNKLCHIGGINIYYITSEQLCNHRICHYQDTCSPVKKISFSGTFCVTVGKERIILTLQFTIQDYLNTNMIYWKLSRHCFLPTFGDKSTLLLSFAWRVGQRGVNCVIVRKMRIKKLTTTQHVYKIMHQYSMWPGKVEIQWSLNNWVAISTRFDIPLGNLDGSLCWTSLCIRMSR